MKNNKVSFAFVTVFIWATLASTVKLFAGNIPDLELLFLSSVLAFLFLAAINVKSGKIVKIKEYSLKDIGYMAFLGFLGLFVYSWLYYHAIGLLTSQEACIINYLWPVMIVVFSIMILKEEITVYKIAAMVTSFIGIIILSGGGEAAASSGRLEGIICCILAAAAYGLFSVLNKKRNYDQNVTMTVIWLTVAVLSLIVGLLTEEWVTVSLNQWAGIIWLGAIVNGLAYLLWARAINESENTALIANLAYLTPFLSVLFSAVLVKERITLRAAVALVFIVGGILIQSVSEMKRSA